MRNNGQMSDAGDFIDLALQREGSWSRADEFQARLGGDPRVGDLRFYGTSVGAVRGTIRDALVRHRGLSHDDVTALSSELWSVPVFERRLAAVVLLQSKIRVLDNADLTRIEGFVRTAQLRELADPLAIDVVGPLIAGLDTVGRVRADSVLDRWAREKDMWLRRAALLSPLRELRAGGGDWGRFVRHANLALSRPLEQDDQVADGGLLTEAVAVVLEEVAKNRPELEFTATGT